MLVTITNFVLVTNVQNSNAYYQIGKGFFDLTNYAAYTAARSGNDPNFWGIPWVVGAVKGLPAFDQYSYTSRIEFLRQLLFVRQTNSSGQPITNQPPASTNQFYVMQISNLFGMDAWNPYPSNFYGANGGLNVFASNVVTLTLTNNAAYPYNFQTNFTFTNVLNYPNPSSIPTPWPGWFNPASSASNEFVSLLQTNFVFLPLVYYSEALQQLVVLNNNGTPFDGFLRQ